MKAAVAGLLAMGLWLAVAAAGPVELRVLMEPDGRGAWRALFEEFHSRNPDVRVRLIEGPTSTDAREDLYVNALLSGSGDFDMVYADTIWIPKFAAAGWLADLTDRWPAERWEGFVRAAIDGGTYKGRIYRVPVQLNGGLLYFRRDLIGDKPPATFEEFVELARAHSEPGRRWGFVWQGKQYEGLVCNFLEILGGFGGFWINPETQEVGLERPEAVRALEFLRDAVGTISPPGVTTYAEEESRLLFENDGAVFLRNWPYVLRLGARDAAFSERVGIAPMPSLPGVDPVSTFGGAGFAVVKSCPNPDAAWRFLEFVTSPWAVQFLNERIGLQPAVRAFYEESEDPTQKQLLPILETTRPRPALPQYAQASDILQRYVSAAITRQLEPAEALRRATAETRRLLR